jgi:hypothetical protein
VGFLSLRWRSLVSSRCSAIRHISLSDSGVGLGYSVCALARLHSRDVYGGIGAVFRVYRNWISPFALA